MDRVTKISTAFKQLLILLVWITPVFIAMYWVWFEQLAELGFSQFALYYQEINITPQTKFLAFLSSLMPSTILIIILLKAISVLKQFEQKEIFIIDNVVKFKCLGLCLVLYAFASVAYDFLLSVIFSYQTAKQFMTININLNQLVFLLFGTLIYVLSLAILEGFKIKKEYEKIV